MAAIMPSDFEIMPFPTTVHTRLQLEVWGVNDNEADYAQFARTIPYQVTTSLSLDFPLLESGDTDWLNDVCDKVERTYFDEAKRMQVTQYERIDYPGPLDQLVADLAIIGFTLVQARVGNTVIDLDKLLAVVTKMPEPDAMRFIKQSLGAF